MSVALVVVLLQPTTAGLTAAPHSVLITSRDRTRVLLLIDQNNPLPVIDWDTGDETERQIPNAAKLGSGVYESDHLRPIWQLDWDAGDWDIKWTDGFESIIRTYETGWSEPNVGNKTVLEIIHQGKPVRSYQYDDLLRHARSKWCVPRWHSSHRILWLGQCEIVGDQLHLETSSRELFLPGGKTLPLGYQEHYVFDLVTGEILATRITPGWIGWTAMVISIVVVIAGAKFAFRRRGCTTMTSE
ncbi:MAG: hypothetical protein R3F19_34465 [Verrucomicrobiales bacterium]